MEYRVPGEIMREMQLSSSQKKAVCHGAGPALVLAGPGSGKTAVITNRILHLIRNEGADPSRILVVTFSRAAAKTMQQRYRVLAGSAGEETAALRETQAHPGGNVIFGTFHAVFFQILKAAYHYTAANILKEEQRAQILRELIDGYRIEGNDRKELMASISAEISRVKNEEIDLEYFYSAVTAAGTFRKLFNAYQEALGAAGLIDFDDMLIHTKRLLEMRPDILAAWQRRFTWILVDEFQDINLVQYRILRMLAAPENNLFAVGDDDQSIYRFRGAKPEILLGFAKDFPGASILHLQENYRSTDEVIRAGRRVISKNRSRFEKAVTGVRGSGEPVHVARLKNVREESEYLARQIREAARRGIPYREMAVLVRTNAAGRYIASRLNAWQVPLRMPDGAPDLFAHWIAQDILSYMRFAAGRDRKDFLQIMNRPLRYISRDCVDTPTVDFERLRMWYEDKPWMVSRLDDLEADIRAVAKLRPYAAVNYIRKAIGYDDYIRQYAQERGLDEEELFEIAGEVMEDAADYAGFAQWEAGIAASREAQKRRGVQRADGSASATEAGDALERAQEGVLLGTLHAAKGLEFSLVFLPDVNEGMLPYRRSSLESEIEEERRLLYVGMTRAKDSLHILYVLDRFGREQKPSRFLRELT